jgi:hypothetical protein
MTIAYLPQPDQSAPLAKRFAHLASSYFDQLDHAQEPAAKIPLGNLFRLLEMFRYDAFSDDPSGGIFNLDHLEIPVELQGREAWHTEIRQALSDAISVCFGEVPKERAIGEVQTVLRWLASGKDTPPAATVTTARDFLRRFEQLLR